MALTFNNLLSVFDSPLDEIFCKWSDAFTVFRNGVENHYLRVIFDSSGDEKIGFQFFQFLTEHLGRDSINFALKFFEMQLLMFPIGQISQYHQLPLAAQNIQAISHRHQFFTASCFSFYIIYNNFAHIDFIKVTSNLWLTTNKIKAFY